MSSSRPSSRSAGAVRSHRTSSYERPKAIGIVSKHAGTVLEDGLDGREKVGMGSMDGVLA